MLEHEFRVWDTQEMGYCQNYFLMGMDGMLYQEPAERETPGAGPMELERCTGLTDTAGRPIYEGDIVHATSFDGMEVTGVVRYGTGSFFITNDGFSGYAWMDYDVTIVGNIHVNPEILGTGEDEDDEEEQGEE